MGKKYTDIISHLLAVLPLSSHRKRSPGNNLIICFCKIRRPVPYQVDCEQSLIFLLNHSNFTFSLTARGPVERRTTARGLPTSLPGAIKYIDHARKLRAQCEVYSTNLGSQFTGSAQTPYRLYDQTDRLPQNSSPLATAFAPLSRQRQIKPVRRAKIWWGNSLLSCMPSSFHGLQKQGLI